MIRLLLPIAAVMVWSSAAHADGPTGQADEAWVAKKDQYMADKASAAAAQTDAQRKKNTASWNKQLDRLIGKPPQRMVNVFNGWTHEYIAVSAGKATEKVADDAVDEFLRCHFTNQPTQMDKRLFVAVVDAAKFFGVDKIVIVSAYRSPKYNLMLRKKGREVAKDSQHTLGHAIDFRLPGISVTRLHKWAKDKKMGGVGLYRGSEFIHIDTGKIRYWGGE